MKDKVRKWAIEKANEELITRYCDQGKEQCVQAGCDPGPDPKNPKPKCGIDYLKKEAGFKINMNFYTKKSKIRKKKKILYKKAF